MTRLIHFHAVMLDECGQEFGAGVEAVDRQEARDQLREMYPENRGIVQLESPEDTAAREQRIYEDALLGDSEHRDYDDDLWEGDCDCGTPLYKGKCADCEPDEITRYGGW